eukprot:gnl/TRDRNA2_/TRDRNA2_148095_c0_seq1.p1 gnl/TRDRNA2_/TRDRNA2_148095_c0~~gnl/TRDRNA2_/TRDRNA2_148095_c0_seq1.p1  ORF type:complete len:326 (-),score=34.37 gnl/TRDRNA2_/TRDRNA2_148095_c0_seq1:355-1233(-)
MVIFMQFKRKEETLREAAVRFRFWCRAHIRVFLVYVISGREAAFSWLKNARRLEVDTTLNGRHYYRCIKDGIVVPENVKQAVTDNFARCAKSPFCQPGQVIIHSDGFDADTLAQLEQLYSKVLGVINFIEPTLQLHPIKSTFSERIYVIDYPGPIVSLPFHYDCNDESDFKAQVLLGKSEGAPDLSYIVNPGTAASSERQFDEGEQNICVFQPHTTFHGIKQGNGNRRVLMFTYTKIPQDRRPIVCHADLISKRRQPIAARQAGWRWSHPVLMLVMAAMAVQASGMLQQMSC